MSRWFYNWPDRMLFCVTRRDGASWCRLSPFTSTYSFIFLEIIWTSFCTSKFSNLWLDHVCLKCFFIFFILLFGPWLKLTNGSLKMCHETSRHTEVEFAPELMMAGHSVTPTHVERRGRRTAVQPGPLTQNTLCRGWPEPESWLRCVCVCVGGEAGGSLEVVCICYRALAVLSVDSGPGVQLQTGPPGYVSFLAVNTEFALWIFCQ